MPIPGNLLTTAMAVMPHTDVDRALEVALSMDIPFWPQRRAQRIEGQEDYALSLDRGLEGVICDDAENTRPLPVCQISDKQTLRCFYQPDL